MKSRIWSAEAGIGLGVGLAFSIAGRSRILNDPGTFWHPAVGRKIWETGRIPEADPFSFTFGGRPWVAYEWLAECGMAAVQAACGLDGLLLLTAASMGLLAAGMAHRLLKGGLAWPPTVVLILMALAVGSNHVLARPHLVTMLGLGLTCAWLGDVEAGRRKLGSLWVMVPGFVVWTNLHGGVLGGIGTVGVVAALWILAKLAGRDSPVEGPRDGLVLGAIVAGCGLALLVNPFGVRLPETLLQLVRSPVLPRMIVEHQPTRLGSPESLAIAALGVVYLVALVGVEPRKWRATWAIPLLWLAAAMARSRHGSLFGITTLVALADILPASRLADWLGRPGRDWFRRESQEDPRSIGLSWIGPAAVVASALGLQAAGVSAPIVGRGWARLDPGYWPTELLPDLRRAERERPGGHVFNEHLFGGFLIGQTPGLRVFVDDRCEVYGDDWLLRLDRAGRDPEELRAWLSEYPIDFALLKADSAIARSFARLPGWSIVRKTRTASFYRRTAPALAASPSADRPGPDRN